jgi:hypothetical protein
LNTAAKISFFAFVMIALHVCRATVFFENTGTTNGWMTLWHEKGNLLQTNSPTYRGPTAVRCETTYDPKYEGRYHTELRKGGMAALGMDRYYGFAFYLPANWEFDNQSYNIQTKAGVYNDAAAIPAITSVLNEGASRRHGAGCVLLSIDGHGEFMKYVNAINLMAANGPNEFWWSPRSPLTGGSPDGKGN